MISLVYITCREDPKFQWFADSLVRHASDDLSHLEVICVDRHLWAITPEAGGKYFQRGSQISLTDDTFHRAERREKFAAAVNGRFKFRHVPPIPWGCQGPFRFTQRDWFSASLNRNTGIICAEGDTIAFVDDLSVLMPTWWAQVKHAAQDGYLCCGAYWKRTELVVENGEVKSFGENPSGRDSRWDRGSETGIVPWSGAGLYGCSFVCPLELLLKVNGSEHYCDMAGGEDFDLGIRLERAGAKVWYNRNLLTYESEEMHGVEPSLPRERKLVSADRLPADYESIPHANEAERFYSDHVLLNRVRAESRFTTLSPHNLRQARAEFQVSQRAMIPVGPTEDWRTGEPLSSL